MTNTGQSPRELAAAVATNLSRLRMNSGIATPILAEITGLSIETLEALEAGRSTPSLRTLLDARRCLRGSVRRLDLGGCLRVGELSRSARRRKPHRRFRRRGLPLARTVGAGDPREPEVYEITLAPGWLEEADPHAPETFEHIVVVRGTLVVRTDDAVAALAAGDVLFFRADRPHTYHNPDVREAMLHLTMIYAGDWVAGNVDLDTSP